MSPIIRTAFSPNICLSCFRKWYEKQLIEDLAISLGLKDRKDST